MTAIVGAGTYWVPVRTEQDDEYTPTPEAKASARAELDRIQAYHEAECLRCALCGQLTYSLDSFGLCSKESVPHREWRQQVRKREAAAGGPRVRKSRPRSAAGRALRAVNP